MGVKVKEGHVLVVQSPSHVPTVGHGDHLSPAVVETIVEGLTRDQRTVALAAMGEEEPDHFSRGAVLLLAHVARFKFQV